MTVRGDIALEQFETNLYRTLPPHSHSSAKKTVWIVNQTKSNDMTTKPMIGGRCEWAPPLQNSPSCWVGVSLHDLWFFGTSAWAKKPFFQIPPTWWLHHLRVLREFFCDDRNSWKPGSNPFLRLSNKTRWSRRNNTMHMASDWVHDITSFREVVNCKWPVFFKDHPKTSFVSASFPVSPHYLSWTPIQVSI